MDHDLFFLSKFIFCCYSACCVRKVFSFYSSGRYSEAVLAVICVQKTVGSSTVTSVWRI